MQYLYLGVLRHVFGVRYAVSVLVMTITIGNILGSHGWGRHHEASTESIHGHLSDVVRFANHQIVEDLPKTQWSEK